MNVIISLLVAADEGNVIGINNTLPWHLPEDLLYFKNQTWGLPILMGRKTFESIGKALPGRTSIVITRNKDYNAEGAIVVHSIAEAVAKAEELSAKEIFVIGGAEIFETSLPQSGRIYLTRIHHRFEGDSFFPAIPQDSWQKISSRYSGADEKNAFPRSYEIWEKI